MTSSGSSGTRASIARPPRFAVYLGVGAFVGLLTVGLRELIGRALPADNPLTYSASVLVAYAFGIALSFVLQRRLTFADAHVERPTAAFAMFGVVAAVGAGVTWLLSLAFRYWLGLDRWLGPFGASVAFGAAALCAAALSYQLNARLVFFVPPARRR